ncbi:MAG: PaaI family thioesterase [Haloechinothrix sp.]
MRTVQQWPPVDTDAPTIHPQAPVPGTKLRNHFNECFGCGDDQPAGLHMATVVGESHTVQSQFTVTHEHQGAPGLAHGGLLACAFDEALGTAVGQLLRKPAVTGRLETDFRKPVPVGSTLFINVTLDGVAGRKVYVSAEGRLGAEDGPIALHARALFVLVGFEHFTTHGDTDSLDKLRRSAREPGGRERWEINP